MAPHTALAEEVSGRWGPEVEGYRLSIRVSKPVFQCQESIKLMIVLKNASPKTGRFSTTGITEIDYPATILLSPAAWIPFRHIIPLTAEGLKRTNPRRVWGASGGLLIPDAERSTELELSTVYDMRLPGQYSVSVVGSVSREGSTGTHRIESNQLDLTIEPCKQ